MKIAIIKIVLSVICVGVSAQDLVINNTKEHITVEGTSLKMIPSENFEKGKNFYGFQQLQTNSTIVVFQVKNNFSKQTLGFTQEHLSKAGFEIREIKRFKLNSDSAVYVSAKQEWEGDVFFKEILAIGNSERTAVINAACLVQHEEMVSQLKEALFSSFIEDKEIKAAIDIVDFSLNPLGTDLEYYEPPTKGLNALLFVNAGELEKPMLIATKSITTINDDHEVFAKESIKILGMIIPEETILFEEITIDGLPGYESVTKGKDKKGNGAFLYRVIVFTPDNYYYSFAGRSFGEMDKNIQRFKKLINTFKRK